jgi:hypothetical protein
MGDSPIPLGGHTLMCGLEYNHKSKNMDTLKTEGYSTESMSAWKVAVVGELSSVELMISRMDCPRLKLALYLFRAPESPERYDSFPKSLSIS